MTTKAISIENDFVRGRVSQYLETRQPAGYHLNITGVKRDGDYFYVIVQPDREDIRSYDYYNILAEVENEIEEKEGLNVLIVPVLPGV